MARRYLFLFVANQMSQGYQSPFLQRFQASGLSSSLSGLLLLFLALTLSAAVVTRQCNRKGDGGDKKGDD